jgi:hypothetical protein
MMLTEEKCFPDKKAYPPLIATPSVASGRRLTLVVKGPQSYRVLRFVIVCPLAELPSTVQFMGQNTAVLFETLAFCNARVASIARLNSSLSE